VLAKDDTRLSVADATGAMLADKGFDVVTLALVAVVFGRQVLVSALASSKHAALVIAGAVVVAWVAWLVLRRFFPRVHERLRSAPAATWAAARSLFTAKRLALGLCLGVAAWLAEVGMLALLCGGIGVHVTFAQSTVALVVLNLGIAVPVSAGNVGAYEAATVFGLAPFGVSMNDALAVGMLHHAVQIVAAVLPALFFWAVDRCTRRPEVDVAVTASPEK
jgi:uncharacterized membrane protein YbhN (UPF0104 family)